MAGGTQVAGRAGAAAGLAIARRPVVALALVFAVLSVAADSALLFTPGTVEADRADACPVDGIAGMLATVTFQLAVRAERLVGTCLLALNIAFYVFLKGRYTWSPWKPGGQRQRPSAASQMAPFWQSHDWLQYQP